MLKKGKQILVMILIVLLVFPAATFADGSIHMTRGEAITLINAAMAFTEMGQVTFRDIKEGDVYYEAVAIAVKAGYLNGYMDRTVRVNQKLKREEVAVLLVNALGLKSSQQGLVISDSKKISPWAKEAVELAVENKLMALDEKGNFNPHRLMATEDWPVLSPVVKKQLVRGDAAQAVTKVSLEGQGVGAISDNQLGFYPPDAFESAPEGFEGWLMMYSQMDLDTVWSYVSSLESETIDAYAKTDEANRMYQITNFAWADGLGNTFRSNQKDVVTGEDFDTGEYYFYVGVYRFGKVVSLVQYDGLLDVKPVPRNISWALEKDKVSVSFESSEDPRVDGFLIFISEASRYDLFDTETFDLESVLADKKGVLIPASENKGEFDSSLNDIITGESFGEGVYNVYVMTVSAGEVFGIGMSNLALVTAPIPQPSTRIINEGIGTILAAGGSTSSSSPDQKPFYEFIRLAAGGGRPKIAILSSSRDSLSVVENHYFFKDPVFGSLEDNFIALGFEPIYIPLAIDTYIEGEEYFNAVAESPYWAGLLSTADAVFLQGGDQAKHAKSLIRPNGEDTLMLEAIRSVYERGGIIAGTSAGLHVMSDPVMGYGTPEVALLTNETEWVDIKDIPAQNDVTPTIANNSILHKGLGLVPETVLLDSHFDARGRLGRLIVAMRDADRSIGIGADEGTGLAIQTIDGQSIGTVVGLRGVFIVDGSEAVYSAAGPEQAFEVSGLVVHYLRAGDRYNFNTGEVETSSDHSNGEGTMKESYGMFEGDYGATHAILDFLSSGLERFEITEKTGHQVALSQMANVSVIMDVKMPVMPFEVQGARVGRADGSGTDFAVTFEFTSALKVGFVGSKGSYLNDLEDPEFFVEVRRGEDLLEQGNSSLMIVSGNMLEVVTKTEDFEAGDQVLLKTTIESRNGVTLEELKIFEYDGQIWSTRP